MKELGKEMMAIEIEAVVYECCELKFVVSRTEPPQTLMRYDEKSKAMRSRAGGDVGGLVWGSKFVAATAATLIIALAGAWLLVGGSSEDMTAGEKLARETIRTTTPRQQQGEVRFTQTGYPAGIRYVSDDYLGNVAPGESSKQLPFGMASDPRMDYLLRENELLRRKVERLKLENAYMQRLLVKRRAISRGGK